MRTVVAALLISGLAAHHGHPFAFKLTLTIAMIAAVVRLAKGR